MTDIVITLVFSVVMLVFMAFPAMKIVEWLKPKTNFSEKVYNILQILITVILSLLIGLFLKFA
jgi:archaellum biogenesis protein FlaJ (TadC family)